MGRAKRFVLIGCATLLIPVVAWHEFYRSQRAGKCEAVGRQLTDHEFLEKALDDERVQRWTGGQSLQSIVAINPDHCCHVVRDQSELYKEDRESFGTYVVQITIGFVQHNYVPALKSELPYKEADIFVDPCGIPVEKFVSEYADPNLLSYPF